MRVSQIQNLTWAGNLVVLGGLVWVGLQFWSVNKLSKKTVELTWAKAKSPDDVGKSRWPGDLAAFEHIWKTPVNGKVPPPPAPPVEVKPKVDRVAEFTGKLKYLTGWEFIKAPEYSTARVNFDGKDVVISPGYSVGGFQLKQFTLDNKKKTAKLVFRNPEGGPDVLIEQPQPATPAIVDPNVALVRKQYSDMIQAGRVSETHIEQPAFQDADGNWVVTEDEQLWIENFGESKLWSKLATKPDTDKDGVSRGLRMMSFPETGTPLAPSHGIGQGDVIRSINGEPITSKEDITNYLRGPGRGLERYEVVVETDGARRTVVFLVRRLHRPARD